MNIDSTLLWQVILISMLVVGCTSYYLARRTTNSPIAATILGLVLAVFPPFGLVYLIVLGTKKGLPIESSHK